MRRRKKRRKQGGSTAATKEPRTMYFTAVLPNESISQEIHAFKQHMLDQYACKVALKSPAHITLYPPFHMEIAKEANFLEQLSKFKPEMEAFEVEMDGFDHFGSRVIFAAPKDNPRLADLRNQLLVWMRDSLGIFKQRYFDQEFHAHMTIANRDIPEESFDEAWDYFLEQDFEKKFSVNSWVVFKLIEKKWEILRKFPLK